MYMEYKGQYVNHYCCMMKIVDDNIEQLFLQGKIIVKHHGGPAQSRGVFRAMIKRMGFEYPKMELKFNADKLTAEIITW